LGTELPSAFDNRTESKAGSLFRCSNREQATQYGGGGKGSTKSVARCCFGSAKQTQFDGPDGRASKALSSTRQRTRAVRSFALQRTGQSALEPDHSRGAAEHPNGPRGILYRRLSRRKCAPLSRIRPMPVSSTTSLPDELKPDLRQPAAGVQQLLQSDQKAIQDQINEALNAAWRCSRRPRAPPAITTAYLEQTRATGYPDLSAFPTRPRISTRSSCTRDRQRGPSRHHGSYYGFTRTRTPTSSCRIDARGSLPFPNSGRLHGDDHLPALGPDHLQSLQCGGGAEEAAVFPSFSECAFAVGCVRRWAAGQLITTALTKTGE